MIEVFKTNVTSEVDAARVVNAIHDGFKGYRANFDLEDCDHILRVKVANGIIDSIAVLRIIAGMGFQAKVLADEIPETLRL